MLLFFGPPLKEACSLFWFLHIADVSPQTQVNSVLQSLFRNTGSRYVLCLDNLVAQGEADSDLNAKRVVRQRSQKRDC